MTGVLARYDALIAAGELKPDPEQANVAARLNALAKALEAVPSRGSTLWKLLGRKPELPRGLYIWGGVGRGKSMLMDLFFASVQIERKRRVHFGEFMLEVHRRIAAERKKEVGDPIVPAARAIAEETRLLAFDEIMVTNSPDAMILSRLFTQLLSEGVTVVTTSNRRPRDLYKDGLNREHFLPFIDLIEAKLDVLTLDGPVDYRRDRLGKIDTWLVPNGPKATELLSGDFFRLTDFPVEDRARVPSEELPVEGGRTLHVPKSVKGVGVFSFKRLCAEARGTPDYLAIARHFHTVFVVGIPRLGPENRNEAARFVSLIDALYEHKVKLLASADAEPDQLYEKGDGRFEFDRTVSRLEEMQSDEYLAQGHGSAGA
ncbi:cell division protein ZapE [Sphingomonas immobilis]|uniref:Cell division protein ZapE n=1 Tax=Sphingomonas immobilis TaxID=3063997 RepID=A0ABT9A2S2_9SPHN|nr:cell division protein ZapE [Sphingomonas sp. CA1-15]MDO7843291.1 cell division protein ZapE [Sphingomonas sp. CA1-15]